MLPITLDKRLPPAIKDRIEQKLEDGNDKPVQTAFMRMAPSSQPAR